MSLYDDLYGAAPEPEEESGGLFADLYGTESEEEILAKRKRRLAELRANPAGDVESDAAVAAKSVLESLFVDTPLALGRGALVGGSNVIQGVQGLGQLVGETTGLTGLAEASKRGYEQQRRYQEDTLGMSDLNAGERIATNIAAQIPQLGGIGALGKIGQANKAVAALGALTGGQEFSEARKAGASMGEAVTSAAVSGVAEAAFERYLGDVPVLKRILSGSGGLIQTPQQALRYLAKNGGQEAAEEALTFVSQRIGQEATYMESYDKDAAEAFRRDVGGLVESAAMGFGLGAGLSKLSMTGRNRPPVATPQAAPETPLKALLPPKPQEALAEVISLKDGQVAELSNESGWAALGLEAAIADAEQRLSELDDTKPEIPDAQPDPAAELARQVGIPDEAIPNPELASQIVEEGSDKVDRVIKDVYDANAATAIRQADEAVAEAVLSGDPAALGDQQTYLAQRQKLEERLLNLREEREKMRFGASEASKALAYAVQSPAEAREAIRAIRARALSSALETRDMEAFDRADEETRRRLELYPGTESAAAGTDLLAGKSPAEAVSTLRDVMVAALPKVEAKANREYNRAVKKGETPAVDKQTYVQQATLAFQKATSSTIQSILGQAQGKPASEVIKKIGQTLHKIQKDFKVDLSNVGYRGNAAMDYQGIIDSGAEWLRGKTAATSGDLTKVAQDDLVALARQAREERAPVAVHDFIASELRRRIDGRPPRRIAPGQGNPEAHEQQMAREIPEQVQVALYGPKTFEAPKTTPELWAHKLRKVIGRLRGQFDAQGQLSHGSILAHTGVSIRDAGAQLTSRAARKLLADRSLNVLAKTEAELHEREYEVAQTLAAFDQRIQQYVQKANQQGGATTSPDEIQRLLYEAYVSENMQALPPDLQSAVKEVMQPLLDKYTNLALENISDPEERETWKANMHRHLFRSYAIFHDPDAAIKALDRSNPAYVRFFEKQRDQNFEEFFKQAYADNSNALREAGYTEAEIQSAIGKMVDDRLHSQIESIVKAHVRTEGQREAVRVASILRHAQEVYREERVLDDPDLREIMGEEKHMALAAQIGLHEIINDAYSLSKRKQMMDLWRANGLIGDTEAPGRIAKLNAETLQEMKVDDPNVRAVYATPEVRDILEGIRTSNEFLSKNVNRAISMLKLGYVLNPGSFLQNVWNVPQTLLSAGGVTGVWDFLRPRSVAFANHVAKEMSHPGSVSLMNPKDAATLMREHGLTPDSFTEAVREMISLGLDTGGEWTIEFEQGAKAVQHGAKPRSTRSKVSKALNAASEFYRRPDLVVKVLAYRAHLFEAMRKEGVETPTPAMQQEAAKRALNTTQNPRTTPQFIRNMSRGAMGLLTFNFAGFTYQMNRNLAYSIKYAAQDAIHAKTLYGLAQRAPTRVEQAELRAKAGRYAKASVDRAAGATISAGYAAALYGSFIRFLVNAATGGDDEKDAQELAPSIRHFRPYNEQTRSNITVLNHWRGKDGNIYSTVVETGRIDIFDQTRQVLAALSGVPQANAPTHTMQPHERVLAALSVLRQQYVALSGLTEAAVRAIKVRTKGGELTVELEDPLGAAEGAFPTIVQTAASAARSIKGAAENPEVGMEDEDYARLVRMMTRNATGFPVRTINHNDDISRSYKQAWAGDGEFLTPMRREWKAAKTAEARAAVKTKYKPQWDRMVRMFSDDAEHAKALGFKPGALRNLLNDKTQIPKYMTSKLALGIPVPLDYYLGNIELE